MGRATWRDTDDGRVEGTRPTRPTVASPRPSALPAVVCLLLAVACGGDATGPEDEPEEYAFVLSGQAGVTIGGEVAAYAMEEGALLEVRELLAGTLDGTDLVWEAAAMVRSALEGGDLDPPPGSPDVARLTVPGPVGAPVEVTVDGRTVAVVGMEFTFLSKIGGPGTVILRGTVNGETRVSGTITDPEGFIGKLILGSVPGG